MPAIHLNGSPRSGYSSSRTVHNVRLASADGVPNKVLYFVSHSHHICLPRSITLPCRSPLKKAHAASLDSNTSLPPSTLVASDVRHFWSFSSHHEKPGSPIADSAVHGATTLHIGTPCLQQTRVCVLCGMEMVVVEPVMLEPHAGQSSALGSLDENTAACRGTAV